MAGLGIANKVLQKAIAHEMVDRLNTRLLNLANQSPRVTYVNVRGTVGDKRWHDELHPTDEGYRDVAKLFEKEIRRLTATRAAPRDARAPPSAAGKLRARRRAKLPTRPEAATARGISLHVGLNAVDPAAVRGLGRHAHRLRVRRRTTWPSSPAPSATTAKLLLTKRGDPQGGDRRHPGGGQEDEGRRHLPDDLLRPRRPGARLQRRRGAGATPTTSRTRRSASTTARSSTTSSTRSGRPSPPTAACWCSPTAAIPARTSRRG